MQMREALSMEGSRRIARRVFSVEREFERSRLESQHLESAYERVLADAANGTQPDVAP